MIMVNPLSILEKIYVGFLATKGIISLPDYMIFSITHSCNSRCIMCNIWKKKSIDRELTLKEIISLFEHPLVSKVRGIIFTGGEPLIRQDLPEIVSKSIESFKNLEEITIATNGLNFSVFKSQFREIIKIINKKKVLSLQFSLDGGPEIHDKIRGVKNAYKNLIETITFVNKVKKDYNNLKLGLNCTVQHANINYLNEVKEIANNLKIKVVFSGLVLSDFYYKNASAKNELIIDNRQKIIDFLKFNEESHLIYKYYYRLLRDIYSGKNRPKDCTMSYSKIYVEHNGDVYPCMNAEDFKMGNLLDNSADEVWFGNRSRVLRKELYYKNCIYCPANCGINYFKAFLSYFKK